MLALVPSDSVAVPEAVVEAELVMVRVDVGVMPRLAVPVELGLPPPPLALLPVAEGDPAREPVTEPVPAGEEPVEGDAEAAARLADADTPTREPLAVALGRAPVEREACVSGQRGARERAQGGSWHGAGQQDGREVRIHAAAVSGGGALLSRRARQRRASQSGRSWRTARRP